jgi:ABC-type transport system involved in Fe-S cluster assembly fused permease/ATPase subunit
MSAPVAKHSFEDVAAARASIGRVIRRLFLVLWRADLARWRPLIVLAFLLTVVAKGFSVAAPVLLGDGINAITGAAGEPQGVGGQFIWLFLAYAASRFLASALPNARDAFFSQVTQDAERVLAVQAFSHAQSLSLQFHLTRRAGALNRIIERGSGAIEYLLRFLCFNIGPTLIELAVAAGVLAIRYGGLFSLVAVLTVGAYGAFTIVITEWRTRQRRTLNEADTELRARAMDSLANFETVKAYGAESREAARYDEAIGSYNRLYVRLMRSLAALNIGQQFLMTGGLLVVAVLAGISTARGRLAAGDITAVVLILMNIYRPLNILGWAWREIKLGMVDMEKLFGLLDIRSDVSDAPNAEPLRTSRGEVRFERVSFVHKGRANGLRDVSFLVPGGAFVGIAGASGAGKSTILRLLFRFYDPDEGRVLIDGQDLRDVTQASLRSSLALVPQEVVLFNDTIRFNVGYAKPEANEEEILSALRRAQLADFVESLPKGLDTRVGERGLKLSGGEKQRIGVARAILKDPPILVLDEATSSLDSETERQVQAALSEAAKGRTTIAVAHRLSTISAADVILVLEDGRIAERGKHAELVAAGKRYARMWARQSHGEEPSPARIVSSMPSARAGERR